MYNYLHIEIWGMKIVINAGIIGSTGYVGEELFRILKAHPDVRVKSIVSKSFSGSPIGDVYGNHLSESNLMLDDLDMEKISSSCDIVFTALPHGQSIRIVPQLMEKSIRVIDMSADFRYKNADVYKEWYKIEHNEPVLLREAVYGLPEFYAGQIKNARLLANPGCYTTASILALYPLLESGLIQKNGIIIDAKSGVSGAGRSEKLAYSFCETADNFKAYGVFTHRHTSEIEQELSIASGCPINLCFTPHLLPVKRGILATIYADLNSDADPEAFEKAYQKRYAGVPFTHVLPHGQLPELKHVVGSNNCYIGYKIEKKLNKVIIISCIDNLIKGAAGQAVQNMNILFGLDETVGLPKTAWYL